jgi:hypothetical protein
MPTIDWLKRLVSFLSGSLAYACHYLEYRRILTAKGDSIAIFQPPERTMKTRHSWLGILILPWILVIGMTGLYLNHWPFVNRVLTRASYDESQFTRGPTQWSKIWRIQFYWPKPFGRTAAFEMLNLPITTKEKRRH